jgi:hypothetical protein
MTYIILVDYFPEGLVTKVNEYIGFGFRPVGGVAVSRREAEVDIYAQAMVSGE